MTPPCYNRPAFVGYWFRTHHVRNGKIVWRWIAFTMSQKCGTWAVPEGETPYPLLNRWNCVGCRWNPHAAS